MGGRRAAEASAPAHRIRPIDSARQAPARPGDSGPYRSVVGSHRTVTSRKTLSSGRLSGDSPRLVRKVGVRSRSDASRVRSLALGQDHETRARTKQGAHSQSSPQGAHRWRRPASLLRCVRVGEELTPSQRRSGRHGGGLCAQPGHRGGRIRAPCGLVTGGQGMSGVLREAAPPSGVARFALSGLRTRPGLLTGSQFSGRRGGPYRVSHH
jgi:hypothetical protein